MQCVKQPHEGNLPMSNPIIDFLSNILSRVNRFRIDTLRRILRIQPLVLTKDDAVKIAKMECESRKTSWTEPVHLAERIRYYRIMTNSGYRGGNVILEIDVTSGNTTYFAFMPR